MKCLEQASPQEKKVNPLLPGPEGKKKWGMTVKGIIFDVIEMFYNYTDSDDGRTML